ncbi:YfbU family protein [Xanthobacter flavus]|uniref:YfbU family protein n=1 Tax=Xanthobacter flavus TaxID=281 RepID=UPI00372C3FB8
MKISPAERLILTMLSDIQLALKSTFSIDSLAVRDAIAFNQTWVLDILSESDEEYTELPQTVIETVNILDMWSNIESSIRNLSAIERREIIAAYGATNCSFQGFYINRDDHYIISKILIGRLNRFSEFSSRSLSSKDSFCLDRYRHMVHVIKCLKFRFPLNKYEIESVISCNISTSTIQQKNEINSNMIGNEFALLSDLEWETIAPLLPRNSRGVARVDDRLIFNGILWRFRSGGSWRSMPERFGSFKTPYNRLARWKASGLWREIIIAIHHLHGPDLILIDWNGSRTAVRGPEQVLDCHVAWEATSKTGSTARHRSEIRTTADEKNPNVHANRLIRTITTQEQSVGCDIEASDESRLVNLISASVTLKRHNMPDDQFQHQTSHTPQQTSDGENNLNNANADFHAENKLDRHDRASKE